MSSKLSFNERFVVILNSLGVVGKDQALVARLLKLGSTNAKTNNLIADIIRIYSEPLQDIFCNIVKKHINRDYFYNKKRENSLRDILFSSSSKKELFKNFNKKLNIEVDTLLKSMKSDDYECFDCCDIYFDNFKTRVESLLEIKRDNSYNIDYKSSHTNVGDIKRELQEKGREYIQEQLKRDKTLSQQANSSELNSAIETALDKMIKQGKSTVSDWINKTTPNQKRVSEIAIRLGYLEDVFTTDYDNLYDFELNLPFYKSEESNNFDPIAYHLEVQTKSEFFTEKIKHALNEIDASVHIDKSFVKNNSSLFLLEAAKKLRYLKEYEKSLQIVEHLLREKNDIFIYRIYNYILHLKSILLSSDKINNYSEALDILYKLYYAHNYHLYEPEIITLIASNLKRLALFDNHGNLKKNVDKELLAKSLKVYKESYYYKIKDEKYYDAINIAYLILYLYGNSIDSKTDIYRLYRDTILQFKQDTIENNWWVAISKIEFELLLDKYSDALNTLSSFKNFDNVSIDEIDTTIRQFKITLQLCSDTQVQENFINFKKILEAAC